MIKQVISFGDSFFYGSELSDCTLTRPSLSTWPALFAKSNNVDYLCLAKPGHSPQYVLRTILDNLHQRDSLFVIMWPSANRYEYYNKESNNWTQLTPNNSNSDIHKVYYGHVNSLLGDKFNLLSCIYTAVQALTSSNIKFTMSLISDFIYTEEFFNPEYVNFLKKETQPYVSMFDGFTFTDWAARLNFTHGTNGHPLEDAHDAAYKYLEPTYKELLCG